MIMKMARMGCSACVVPARSHRPAGRAPGRPVVIATLSSDVEARLRALGPDLGDHDMRVLLSYQREGESPHDLAGTHAGQPGEPTLQGLIGVAWAGSSAFSTRCQTLVS